MFVFTYTEISMMRFFVMLVMYAHWNACLWGMVAHPDIQPDYNWMFRLEETMNANSVMRCRVSQDHAALQGLDIDASVAYLNSNFDDSASLAGVGTYKPNWAPYCVGSESETCRAERLNIGADYAPSCEFGYEGNRFPKKQCAAQVLCKLYFAAYTMTGIGLGDISATGNLEVMVATAISALRRGLLGLHDRAVCDVSLTYRRVWQRL